MAQEELSASESAFGDDELEEICNHDPPEARQRAVHADDAEQHHDQDPLIHLCGLRSGEDRVLEDGDHRAGHPADDDGIDQQRDVERAKATQEGSRLTAVTQFDQLDVGQHTGPPPEPGIEEHGDHAADGESPPEPVAGQAVPGHQPGDGKGGVRREGGGDHGSAG